LLATTLVAAAPRRTPRARPVAPPPPAAPKPKLPPAAVEPDGESKPETGPIIAKILVRGNKKIEADAIRAKIGSKEGGHFTDEQIAKDIREVFSLGFFSDVQVDRAEGGGPPVLTYIVKEKPSVVEIQYKGNNELSDDELKETSTLKPFEIVNVAKIREATEKMEKMYEDKGFFLARVNHRLVPTGEGDNVRLIFDIKENDKVRVKRISFIGNAHLNSEKLKSIMVTKEGSFFSFISGAGAYKQEAFDRDVQMLNILYFNEGYVQMKLDRPQVYVSPDKRDIYISIRVEEGEQYKVGKVDFTGDLLFSREELFQSTHIQEQEIFKYQVLQDDLKALQAKYGDLGYAYANPIPRTMIHEAEREVDITFEIDKGQKVYLGRINMVGNTKTRDKVIRRELRIMEGELYNETRKRESFDNVKRLGFFEDVNFNTHAPKGHPEIMDIDIVVKERNTGTVQIGAGYSTYNGFIFNGQVNQTNFLGKGQNLGVSIDLSKRQSLYRASFTEPYFMDTEWLLGGEIYQSQRSLLDYTETKTGSSVRVGHPLAPYLDGSIRYKLDRTRLHLLDDGDPALFPVETANGTTSSVTLGVQYDKRDDRFTPSKGLFSSFNLEYAGVGGTLSYTKGIANLRYYRKVFWDVVWRNNITYGFISPNDNREAPFNELFLLGGANTIRGFNWFTIGRTKYSQKAFDQVMANTGGNVDEANAQSMRPYGGRQELYYNLEFQFPLINEAGVKGVVFYDAGVAEDSVMIADVRQAMGFGFRWFSPIGPLRFEWGFPLDRKPDVGEQPMVFEFAIGAPF
jgi:outer membrane protein insertion porin family